MQSSQEKRMQQWSVMRAKGKRRFVLIFGLAFGLSTGLLTWLSLWFIGVCNNPAIDAPIFLVIFVFTGFAWSQFIWRSSEKAYLAYEQRGS